MLIRPARPEDVDNVRRLVDAAYEHYVDLIGGRPRPMQADYRQLTADEQVEVAEDDGGVIVGVLVTEVTDDDFVIENVAVHPDHQGRGIGRLLLDHAEATAARRHDSVRLYTHQLMTDNLAIYRHRGYVEFATEPLPDGRHVVHLRKQLGG